MRPFGFSFMSDTQSHASSEALARARAAMSAEFGTVTRTAFDPARRAPRRLYHTNGFNPPRPIEAAARRGWSGRCPACGEGALFGRWMQVSESCAHCGEALGHARVTNAVAVLAIPLALLAGSLVGGILELLSELPLALELAASELVAVAAAFHVLPRAKGLAVGLAWANHVGGFDPLRHLVPDPEAPAALPPQVQAP